MARNLDLRNLRGAPVLSVYAFRTGASGTGALAPAEWLQLMLPTWARFVSIRADGDVGEDLLVAVPGPPDGVVGLGAEGDGGEFRFGIPVFAGGSPVQLPLGEDVQATRRDGGCEGEHLAQRFPTNTIALWSLTPDAPYSIVLSRWR
jgi:hypothetical protein